jgi:hypothetical protein
MDKGGGLLANTRGRLSAAQRRTLEALNVDGAQIMPNTSANWYVRLGPYFLTTVRWETVQALAKSGYIASSDWPGAYRITHAGRVALAEAEDTKGSETA